MKPLRRPIVTLLIPGVVLIALACVLGAVILAREEPFPIDTAWNSLLVQWQSDLLDAFGLAMNWLGGGWFGVFAVPILAALALMLARRWWATVYFLAAEIFSAAFVQVLKHLYGRARPEEIIVISDYGSFPSGHTANAATIAAVAIVLFPRLWVLFAGVVWVVLMGFSRTYVHAHWFTDTVGGTLAGVGVALVLAAAFAAPLRQEAARAERRVPVPSLG
jgi:membrane-associated phospholipid phosphatase